MMMNNKKHSPKRKSPWLMRRDFVKYDLKKFMKGREEAYSKTARSGGIRGGITLKNYIEVVPSKETLLNLSNCYPGITKLKCPNCRYPTIIHEIDRYSYCPNCGKKIVIKDTVTKKRTVHDYEIIYKTSNSPHTFTRELRQAANMEELVYLFYMVDYSGYLMTVKLIE